MVMVGIRGGERREEGDGRMGQVDGGRGGVKTREGEGRGGENRRRGVGPRKWMVFIAIILLLLLLLLLL